MEIKSFIKERKEVLENGKIVVKFIKKEINPRDYMEGLTVDDFSLSNILATGSTELLKEQSGLSRLPLTDADNLDDAAINIHNNKE